MSDSNVDWNQALPEVAQFARQHGLTDVPLDAYGFSDTRRVVPNSRVWDCQAPADSDAGHWVFVSANMILDSHNCGWILQYPHQQLAGGGMYAIQLPSTIPPPGSPGGPPPPAERWAFLHQPTDMRALFLELSDHPGTIPKVLDEMIAAYQKTQADAQQKPDGK